MTRRGFTLAEVLITLGIIGVVSALTIPSVINKHQKKVTATKLQKSVSILNQAYRLSVAEAGEHDNSYEIGSDEYFNTYWKPYLKSVKICPRNSNGHKQCGYSKHQPFLWANNTASDREFTRNEDDRTTFYTPDGFLYTIYTALDGNIRKDNGILVDINGSQGPNRFGRDVFLLTRTKEMIVPDGYDKTDTEINTNCSKSGQGGYCAEKIRRNSWQIPANYPW